MAINGKLGILIDIVTGRPRRWYVNADGIRRWLSNDQPCNSSHETDLWKCTVCGRVGTVGRCCGEDTREPVECMPTTDHRHACTGSNEPGKTGSAYV